MKSIQDERTSIKIKINPFTIAFLFGRLPTGVIAPGKNMQRFEIVCSGRNRYFD
jgi:hypothetical protein